MKKFLIGAVTAGLMLATVIMPAGAVNSSNYNLTPFEYVGAAGDCGTGYPAGTPGGVVAKWDNTSGNPSPSLLLEKNVPTTDCSAAGATVNGVEGITLSELNYDVMGYCGAGAPRFNVVTSDNVTHFFGCASGTQTDLGNGWTHVVWDPSNPTQAYPVITPGETVTSIELIQDEQGSTHLDNISINDQVIGGPSVLSGKNQCKNGGWMSFTDPTFRNQGDCVSWMQANPNATGNRKDN